MVHWLWMNIRWISLPALPTAPHKYLTFQWSPRMFYYGSAYEPYDIFYPKPRTLEEIDTQPKARQDQSSFADDQIPLLEKLN